jgi:two-component system, NarL family, nitrate/nitrite response regulator NarL
MTLDSAARKIGVSPRTAEDYLNRVKKKYEEAGRPARTKLELAQRFSEDGLEDEPGRCDRPATGKARPAVRS